LQSGGCRFESQPGLLRTKVYSAFHPPGSVNEYQLRLGRQRQVWLIPIADERVGMQVKLWNPWVVIHYEEARYQVYAPLPLSLPKCILATIEVVVPFQRYCVTVTVTASVRSKFSIPSLYSNCFTFRFGKWYTGLQSERVFGELEDAHKANDS